MRESTVEKALVKAARDRGGIAYKFRSLNRPSVPDRIVLLRGRMAFVECKAPGEKPTKAQLREHARLGALGFKVLIIDHAGNAEHIVGAIERWGSLP